MNNFNELPDGEYMVDDPRVQLFLPLMNKLVDKKIVSPTDPWDFLYGDDEESVVAYVCWEGVKTHEKQLDIHIDEENDEIEVVLWHDDFIRYIIRFDLNLREKSVFLR